MKTKDLASWFGISYGAFRNKKQVKLEELKEYAKFEEVYGGVDIKEVKIDEYMDKSARKVYEKGFDEVRGNIDTISSINEKIYYKYKDNLPTLSSPESGYHYAIEMRNAKYGIPYKAIGNKGKCYYVWCKVDRENQLYIPYTEEEIELSKKMMKKHFGTDEEKDIMIAQMVDAGEISEAEAYRLTREYRGLNKQGFMSFKKEMEKLLGMEIVRATQFEEGIFFEEEEKKRLTE